MSLTDVERMEWLADDWQDDPYGALREANGVLCDLVAGWVPEPEPILAAYHRVRAAAQKHAANS